MRTREVLTAGLVVLFALTGGAMGIRGDRSSESGTLSIYFMEEKVGYEEYSWSEEPGGYVLKVTGRMTKPLSLEVESLTLRLSRDFIPAEYSFRGTLNGVTQEVTSSIQEGRVKNTIRSAGQETVFEARVRRDALLLPNPIFSPYLALVKRYRCGLKGKVEVSAYLIPQVEIPGSLESAAGNPCALTLKLAGVEITLETDADGRLLSLSMPAQNIRVKPERVE